MQQLRLNRKLAFDHYIGGPLAWLLNISACLIAKVIRRDHSLTRPPRAVLFIKFIGLGSVVRGSFLVTAVRAKYPDAKIYFASFPAVSPLVSMFDEVDEVKVVRDDTIPHLLVDTLELLFWCWRKKIDLVIDLELHAKYSAIVSVLSMARDRAGFAGISSRFRRGLYTHLVFWNPVRYIGKAYRQLAEALALPDASEAPISIPPSAQAEAVQCLQTLGWTSEMRIIGINPNASDLRTERKWPERYFAALIDMLPADLKAQFKKDFEAHIAWLEPQDRIQRAVGGFRGAIEFMMATDNSHLLPDFWRTVNDLDWSRNESLLAVVPELAAIIEHRPEEHRLPTGRTHRILKQE